MRHTFAALAFALATSCSLGGVQSAAPSVSPDPASAAGYVPPEEAVALIDTCGVSGTIDAYFRIPAGATYRTVFPQAGQAPELDDADEPFVVIYSGHINYLSTMPLPTLRNAVCMYSADGYPNIYPNLPLEGIQLPPGAHLGAPQ